MTNDRKNPSWRWDSQLHLVFYSWHLMLGHLLLPLPSQVTVNTVPSLVHLSFLPARRYMNWVCVWGDLITDLLIAQERKLTYAVCINIYFFSFLLWWFKQFVQMFWGFYSDIRCLWEKAVAVLCAEPAWINKPVKPLTCRGSERHWWFPVKL